MNRSLIDSHVHFSCHSRLDELERYCDRVGAEKICALSLPVKERINFNPEVLFAKVLMGARCYGLASFDYSEVFYPELSANRGADDGGRAPPDLADQVEQFHQLGFDGLKLFLGKPTFQRQLGFGLRHPTVLTALKRAQDLAMPALIHVADPPQFWPAHPLPGFVPPGWSMEGEDGDSAAKLPGYEELQDQAVAVLEACPGLAVIFPHLLMMAHDLERLAALLERYQNAYLDLAPGLYSYYELDRRRPEAREFFRRFQDRILLGSDGFWFSKRFNLFPYVRLEDNLERMERLLRFLGSEDEMDNPFLPTQKQKARVCGLGLEVPILENVFRGNFLRLFSQPPRQPDPALVHEYLNRFCRQLHSIGAEAQVIVPVAGQMQELGRWRGGSGR